MLKLKDRELSDLRLKSIGFVFQSFQLMPRESAVENVALPLSYAGVRKKERRIRATKALERVGLGDRVNFRPTQLSGGQKQRVAIARAMVNHPKILLADEPTGALDSKSGEQIMELFDSLNEEGVTIVMITHDPRIAAKAKRIVRIIDGEIYEGEGDGSGIMKIKKVIAVIAGIAVTLSAAVGGVYGYKSYHGQKACRGSAAGFQPQLGYWGDTETSYGTVTKRFLTGDLSG